MIFLNTVLETLELKTNTVADIDYQINFVDVIANTSATPGSTQGKISTITSTVITNAPAASTSRQIKSIIISNTHTSTPNIISVNKDISTVEYKIINVELKAGEVLNYESGSGWSVIDALGNRKTSQSVAAPGSDQEVVLNVNGTLSTDPDFTWDSSTRKLFLRGTDTGIRMLGVDNEPSTPLSGRLEIYAKAICGKMALKIKGSSGLDSPLQPALYQNTLWFVSPNTTTSVSAVGGAVTSTGTISTVTPSTTTFGLTSNFATAATVNATAGTGQAVTPLNTSAGVQTNGGFFIAQRLIFPDTNYGIGATGSRIFVGATSNTLATEIISDNAIGNRIGFAISTNLSETKFMITSKDGVTETRFSTDVPLVSNNLYDFYLFIPPGGTIASWRIDNISTGVSVDGVVTTNLPIPSVYMRAGFQISTLTTVARNVRMKKIYVETDN